MSKVQSPAGRSEFAFHDAYFIGPTSYFLTEKRRLMFPHVGQEVLCWADDTGNPILAHNRCVHRGMRLVSEHLSEGPLVCPYHSLSYDHEGILKGRGSLAGASLQRLHKVSEDSGFFITSDLNSESQLSRVPLNHSCFPRGLEKAPYFSGYLHHKCNWKLIVENVLEAKHISSVHKKTFVKQGFLSPSYSDIQAGERFSYAELRKVGGQRGYYRHFYVWPNLFISDTDGLVTFVSTVFPVSADETLKIWHIYPSTLLQRTPIDFQKKILDNSVQFTKSVLLEDREILEEQQKAYTHYSWNVLDSNQEQRVQWFYSLLESLR